MKKLIVILLVLSLVIVISGCKNNEDVENSNENLTEKTIGKTYNLSEDDALKNIILYPRKIPVEVHKLSQEEFQKIYKELISLEYLEVVKGKSITTKNGFDYNMHLISENKAYSFEIGETYFIVQANHEDYMYKYEISDEDYNRIIDIIEDVVSK